MVNVIIFINYTLVFLMALFTVYLCKKLSYAWGDTCCILSWCSSLEKNTVQNQFVSYKRKEHMASEFEANIAFYPYALFLNIIKWIRKEHRLRGAQILNISLFVLSLAVMCFTLKRAIMLYNPGLQIPLSVLILFPLLIGVRAKMLVLCFLAYTDILSHFLIVMSIMYAAMLADATSFYSVLCFGWLIGLCFRNRPWESFHVFFAGLIYLLYLQVGTGFVCLYILGVLIVNIDMGLLQLRKKWHMLKGVFAIAMPNEGLNDKKGHFIYKYIVQIVDNVATMFNSKKDDSLWGSIGLLLLLLPVSVMYMISYKMFTGVFIFIAVLTILHVILFLPAVGYSLDRSIVRTFFGSKEMFLLFWMTGYINASAFIHMYVTNNKPLYLVYLFMAVIYFVYQCYRFMDYHFAQCIKERFLANNQYQPYTWSIDLAEYIKSNPEPMVILAYHALLGEVHDFYKINNRDKRSVDLKVKVTDEEVDRLICQYGITHIAITPMGQFIFERTTLLEDPLNEFWAGRLRRNDSIAEVVLYDVIKEN